MKHIRLIPHEDGYKEFEFKGPACALCKEAHPVTIKAMIEIKDARENEDGELVPFGETRQILIDNEILIKAYKASNGPLLRIVE